MSPKSVELNGVGYRWPSRPVVVVCIDGGDPAYFDRAIAALAHDHDDVEIPQPFGDRVRIGEMVVEHGDFGPLGDGRPVRNLQGHVLEIV